MKNLTYVLLLLSALHLSSCHKSKNEKTDKTCTSKYIGFKRISNATFHLVGIDTETGMGQDSPYNFTFTGPFGTGAVNTSDNCYYLFQMNPLGKIKLVRYNLVTHAIDSINYSGKLDSVSDWYANRLWYNDKTKKLYYIYTEWGAKMYEIIMTDNSSTDKLVFSVAEVNQIFAATVDGKTGNFYFNYEAVVASFNPEKNEFVKFTEVSDKTMIQFNGNDNKLYGLSYSNPSYSFIKIDPNDGKVTYICPISVANATDRIYSAFDQCKNQYVLYKYDATTFLTLDIYWINPKDGTVTKHVMPNENYTAVAIY